MSRPRLFLIDTFGFIFRAYHARARSAAPTMRTSTGLPTEAVYIFTNMLRKLITSYQPEFIAAVFESSGPTFREQEFAEYKANRTEAPPELIQQIGYIRRLLGAMRIPVLEYPRFEADDVIGAIARRAEAADLDVTIVSSDKDMLQIVDERISMYNPIQENLWYDPAKVEEKMGVKPAQVADLLALKGDPIDNIPGAPGIGEKGAREIILRFGSVEAALERAAELGDKGYGKRYRESLQQNRERILLSKRLATIDTSVPVEFRLEDVRAQPPDTAALKELYKELEFYSLLKELGPEVDTRPRDYATLDTPEAVDAWLAAIPPDAPIAVAIGQAAPPQDTEPGFFSQNEEPFVALCWQPAQARSVRAGLIERLRPMLEDEARPKVGHDVKRILLALGRFNIRPRGFRDDVMLYAFLLNADPSGCSLEVLARRYLDRRLETTAEHHADCALELAGILSRQVDDRGFRELYETIDRPLIEVLARMEQRGIRIDPAEMRRLSEMMDAEIQRLTQEICRLAGKSFNINSPQQLGKVLFEDLKLPAPVRYGRGKTISTAADVLEELAADHEIVRQVLEYRQLAKLKGTYVDALPALIDPRTGRLHTSFNQTGAATGRLSSSNPNLQNIPIRTELGREIRAAFVPREGWKLLVADYSQIELRLLAHFSKCPVLTSAFQKGEDIHTRTAAEVFGVPPLMVNPELRRRAKAINFGIVYGLSAFGLAAQLGIPRHEAQTYIDNYFARYPGVKRFIEETIAEVRRTGVTKTLFGRERPIPDMNSRNPNARGFAERTAVNTPLQGTAADLIKLAMIRIEREIERRKLRTAMLLQVHDELLFEAPPEEVDEVKNLVKRNMEEVHKLEVPLVADVGVGDNWRDAK
ncbi:MAG TPA: DNA polymerase I [Bryobacteraceae bacterium]|nr:DNA polymerase I [Bryobacteraceae bacterium]HOQ46033.1 DNA polymerase I [Bryobacteraceae bacterium]HPQ15318.1 DNA polymerase I [Bryobacteraceae bacterium]HPU72857.1 DNA polymerase I [Bryobacteraceae bacterium]